MPPSTRGFPIFFLSWWSIPHPQEQGNRQFPTLELLIVHPSHPCHSSHPTHPSYPRTTTTSLFSISKILWWSIINAEFWLVELLLGYMPTNSEKLQLWKPKQWRLNRVLLSKVVLSRYFWPTSWICYSPWIYYSPRTHSLWVNGLRPHGLLTQSPFGLEE